MLGAIDEKHGVFDIVFLREFLQKSFSQRGRSRRERPHMENSVRFRIDCSVQPIPVIIDLNHGLVERNVIRSRVSCWL